MGMAYDFIHEIRVDSNKRLSKWGRQRFVKFFISEYDLNSELCAIFQQFMELIQGQYTWLNGRK
jgi:hypothetical protein